jgi:hypothetical protein
MFSKTEEENEAAAQPLRTSRRRRIVDQPRILCGAFRAIWSASAHEAQRRHSRDEQTFLRAATATEEVN